MQEVLVRGYLYQMIKNNYNIVVAVLISTGLFTFAHGGAFEAGILPVLNVITMSLFVTAVLEYPVFIMPTYTSMLDLRGRLQKRLGGKEFWE